MKIAREGSLADGRLVCRDMARGCVAGWLSYKLRDRYILMAEHTVVEDAYQGQGLARELVEALVALCRERKVLLEPVCSYVERMAIRRLDWQDLLEAGDRAPEILAWLEEEGDEERARMLGRYFKTGVGEYAHGDRFAGISVPKLRALLKELGPLSLGTIESLIMNPLHDARWLGFVALVQRARGATSSQTREQLCLYYLDRVDYCNNWDLVDSSAPTILGQHLLDLPSGERLQRLLELIKEDHLWRQRIAVVATLGLIRRGSYSEAIELSIRLRNHRHDLIHKASGWMLREVGKRDRALLLHTLDLYAPELPRTTLRYAIERLSDEERRHYMTLRR